MKCGRYLQFKLKDEGFADRQYDSTKLISCTLKSDYRHGFLICNEDFDQPSSAVPITSKEIRISRLLHRLR